MDVRELQKFNVKTVATDINTGLCVVLPRHVPTDGD